MGKVKLTKEEYDLQISEIFRLKAKAEHFEDISNKLKDLIYSEIDSELLSVANGRQYASIYTIPTEKVATVLGMDWDAIQKRFAAEADALRKEIDDEASQED